MALSWALRWRVKIHFVSFRFFASCRFMMDLTCRVNPSTDIRPSRKSVLYFSQKAAERDKNRWARRVCAALANITCRNRTSSEPASAVIRNDEDAKVATDMRHTFVVVCVDTAEEINENKNTEMNVPTTGESNFAISIYFLFSFEEYIKFHIFPAFKWVFFSLVVLLCFDGAASSICVAEHTLRCERLGSDCRLLNLMQRIHAWRIDMSLKTIRKSHQSRICRWQFVVGEWKTFGVGQKIIFKYKIVFILIVAIMQLNVMHFLCDDRACARKSKNSDHDHQCG